MNLGVWRLALRYGRKGSSSRPKRSLSLWRRAWTPFSTWAGLPTGVGISLSLARASVRKSYQVVFGVPGCRLSSKPNSAKLKCRRELGASISMVSAPRNRICMFSHRVPGGISIRRDGLPCLDCAVSSERRIPIAKRSSRTSVQSSPKPRIGRRSFSIAFRSSCAPGE